MNAKVIKAAKTEVEKLEKELKEAKEAANKYRESMIGANTVDWPKATSKKCPHCKAKSGNPCITSKGYKTSDHASRKKLFAKEYEQYWKEVNKQQVEYNKMYANLEKLQIQYEKARGNLKRQEECAEFLSKVKRYGKAKAELVVECGEHMWTVAKSRNLLGVCPGMELPGKSLLLTEKLMRRGVDVTLVKKAKSHSGYPQPMWPTWRM